MDFPRRHFLRGHFGATQSAIRLPWLVSERDFFAHCTRCGKCVEACAEKIVVRGDGGYPEINFATGACTFCQQCAKSCPESLFPHIANSKPWHNVANISSACLSNNGVDCQSCRDACETNAITFIYTVNKVPGPRLQQDLCTGCGACVSVCPTTAISVISSNTLLPGDKRNGE